MIDFPPISPINSQSGTEVLELPETETVDSLDVPWQVIIYNDPVNLMSFVSLIIQRLFGYDEDKARACMLEVHYKGKCIVWSGHREKAEFYVQQLHSHQLLAGMRRAPA